MVNSDSHTNGINALIIDLAHKKRKVNADKHVIRDTSSACSSVLEIYL
jgi:hypothetical protein